jgi:hypothetical protein
LPPLFLKCWTQKIFSSFFFAATNARKNNV